MYITIKYNSEIFYKQLLQLFAIVILLFKIDYLFLIFKQDKWQNKQVYHQH